jgi:hypothetical protein
MPSPTIVGIGGFPNPMMVEYVLGLARGRTLVGPDGEEPLESRLL